MQAYIDIAFPVVVWIALRLLLPSGPYEMDSSGLKGTFFPIMAMYQLFFYLLAIASGIIVSHTHTAMSSTFMNAGLDALLFNGLLIVFYERYLQQRYPKGPVPGIIGHGPSNYTVSKYATILALGWSAFMQFGVGVICLVYRVWL